MSGGSYVLVYVDDVAFATRRFRTMQALGRFAARRGLSRFDCAIIEGDILRDIARGSRRRSPPPECEPAGTGSCVEAVDPEALRNIIEARQQAE
jgi:hypothetical protein